MNIKEEIHSLSEEMLTNLGRLVAIDSQLGTPAEGKPFGEGPAKALEEGLKIADELGFKTVNLDNYCGYAEMVRAMRSLESPDIWISCQWVVTGLMIHLSLPVKATMYTDVELPMTKVRFWKRSTP